MKPVKKVPLALVSLSLALTACHTWHGPTLLSERVDAYTSVENRDLRIEMVPQLTVKSLLGVALAGDYVHGKFILSLPNQPPLSGRFIKEGGSFILVKDADGQIAMRLSVQPDKFLRDDNGNLWQHWERNYR